MTVIGWPPLRRGSEAQAGPAAAGPGPHGRGWGERSARGPGGPAAGSAERVRGLIEQLELEQPADLVRDQALLRGVWELRWSSSSLPYLAVAAWLENLQLLDPANGRGMNLLRLAGPLGPVAGIAVQAAIPESSRMNPS